MSSIKQSDSDVHIYIYICICVCVCVYIYIYIYIFFFIFFPPMMVYHRHCIEFPVLSGSTFFIHSLSSHLYLLIPNSQSIPPCLTLATTSLFSVFVSLYNMVSKLKFMALSGASSRREGCCAGCKDQRNCPVLWRWLQKPVQSRSGSLCSTCRLHTLAHTVACCVHGAGLQVGAEASWRRLREHLHKLEESPALLSLPPPTHILSPGNLKPKPAWADDKCIFWVLYQTALHCSPQPSSTVGKPSIQW